MRVASGKTLLKFGTQGLPKITRHLCLLCGGGPKEEGQVVQVRPEMGGRPTATKWRRHVINVDLVVAGKVRHRLHRKIGIAGGCMVARKGHKRVQGPFAMGSKGADISNKDVTINGISGLGSCLGMGSVLLNGKVGPDLGSVALNKPHVGEHVHNGRLVDQHAKFSSGNLADPTKNGDTDHHDGAGASKNLLDGATDKIIM